MGLGSSISLTTPSFPCTQDASLLFDKVNDVLTVGAGTKINDIFGEGGTVSFWIYPKSSGEGTNGRVLDKAGSSTTGWRILMANESGGTCKVKFNVDYNTGEENISAAWTTSGRNIIINAWNHVVLTYSGTSTANDPVMIINGVNRSITENTEPEGDMYSDASHNLLIGNNHNGSKTFDGHIQHLALWKATSLSLANAQAIYNSGKPAGIEAVTSTSELVFWLPMNHGADGDDKLIDKSGNGVVTTVTTAPAWSSVTPTQAS